MTELEKTADGAGLVDSIAHPHQLAIWSAEIASAIAELLKDRWTFDDAVMLEGLISAQVRRVVKIALTHPEINVTAEIERLTAERDSAIGKWEAADGMDGSVVHAIRQVLTAANVPRCAFIDDQVGNAIVQRDLERARAEAAEKELIEIKKTMTAALKPFAAMHVASMANYPDGTERDARPKNRYAWGFNKAELTWGDFQTAAEALQQISIEVPDAG